MTRATITLLAILAVVIALLGGFYWTLTRRPQASRQQQPKPIPPAALTGFQVFLHHEPCVGGCPAYAVLAKGASGTIEYSGGEHVATTGAATAPVSDKQLAALYRAVKRAKFFSIGDVYHNGPGGTGCDALVAGKPRVVIGVTRDERTKVIHYDYGCKGAPAALGRLAAAIDRILDTRRWTAGSAGTGG